MVCGSHAQHGGTKDEQKRNGGVREQEAELRQLLRTGDGDKLGSNDW